MRRKGLTMRPESLNLPGVPVYVEMGDCPEHGRVILPCVACRTRLSIEMGSVTPRADWVQPRLLPDATPNPRYRPESPSLLQLKSEEQTCYDSFWGERLPPVLVED